MNVEFDELELDLVKTLVKMDLLESKETFAKLVKNYLLYFSLIK